jgi:hypothetical protein
LETWNGAQWLRAPSGQDWLKTISGLQ